MTGMNSNNYIHVKHRYRNSVRNARSYPGADVNSDHNLVAMSVSVKLKKLQKPKKVKEVGCGKGAGKGRQVER